MKFGYRQLGAALVRRSLAHRSVAPIETATPICGVEFIKHRYLHGVPGIFPSFPYTVGVYPECRIIVDNIRSNSFSALKPEGSSFSTLIASKFGGPIGTSGLRCGANERTYSGMDGSAEPNPVLGKRDKKNSLTFQHRSESQNESCHISEKRTVTFPNFSQKLKSWCVPQ